MLVGMNMTQNALIYLYKISKVFFKDVIKLDSLNMADNEG